MPNIADLFPSPYLKAVNDIPKGGSKRFTITKVEVVALGQGDGQEEKPVVYFRETEKGLVLNKTNAGAITAILGTGDTDAWIGKQITLVCKMVEAMGKVQPGIRVSLDDTKEAKADEPPF